MRRSLLAALAASAAGMAPKPVHELGNDEHLLKMHKHSRARRHNEEVRKLDTHVNHPLCGDEHQYACLYETVHKQDEPINGPMCGHQDEVACEYPTVHACNSNGSPTIGAILQADGTYVCEQCGLEGAAACECTKDSDAVAGGPCDGGIAHWCLNDLNAVVHPDVPGVYTCRGDVPVDGAAPAKRVSEKKAHQHGDIRAMHKHSRARRHNDKLRKLDAHVNGKHCGEKGQRACLYESVHKQDEPINGPMCGHQDEEACEYPTIHSCNSNGSPTIGAILQADGTYVCEACGNEGAAACECTKDNDAVAGGPCDGGIAHWCLNNLNAVVHPDVPGVYTCRGDVAAPVKHHRKA